MKVEAECAGCIVGRAVAQVSEATTNPAIRFRTMVELLRLLIKEFKPTAVPAELGTKRDRLIKRITGNNDPYKRIKRMSSFFRSGLLVPFRVIIKPPFLYFPRLQVIYTIIDSKAREIPGARHGG